MNVFLVVLLVLAGVALLLMEMFLLPGFGIAGISGFGCLVAAVVLAWLWIGKMAGFITLAACLILSCLAIWGFLRSNALDKMALNTKIDSHVELAKNKLEKKEETKELTTENK
jgi:membrane protein implicated in regulation of membrane protease activity